MTSLLAGTVAHGARGGRGVSTSHYRRASPGLSGTPRHSPELPGNGSHNTNYKSISDEDRCDFTVIHSFSGLE